MIHISTHATLLVVHLTLNGNRKAIFAKEIREMVLYDKPWVKVKQSGSVKPLSQQQLLSR